MDNEISAVMTATMSKIKEMVDTNTVVGEPITTPDDITTENFYLSREGVTFYYNVYDITPYSMGPVKVTIPFPMLEHLLGSNPILGELKD